MRVLILMGKTGAGHAASAVALRAAFEQRFCQSVQVSIVDILGDHLPRPLRRLPDTYPFLANDAPWLWEKLWHTDVRHAHPLFAMASRASMPAIQRLLQEQAPDLIVSVHPLAQTMTMPALTRLAEPPPFATVVTDLISAHPLWFDPSVRRCYVASRESWRRAQARGLQSSQLRQFGLPIRPEFVAPSPNRASLRAKLGLASDLPLVLIAGGGDGIGPLEATARAVSRALAKPDGPCGQIVVICGHNDGLQQTLTAARWPLPVRILGFVDNMAEWMQAADCLITKAGPGTIAEAMACGLPLILSSFIPGQEEENVSYVVQNGLGTYHGAADAISAQVLAWFGPAQDERIAAGARALRCAHPYAAREIVADLAGLIGG